MKNQFPIQLNSKAPLHKAHRELEYTDAEIQGYRDRGHAIGLLVPASTVVVDVDPRNGGNESFARLDAQLDIKSNAYKTVATPTGGFHYYMSKSNWVGKKTLRDYPGIDFISGTGYVLTEGSPHPKGGTYKVVASNTGRTTDNAGDCLRFLTEKVAVTSDNTSGEYNANNLSAILSAIPVESFHGDRQGWFEILASSHFATGGCPEAREVFLDWCVSDGVYAGDRDGMSYQWDSLADSGITTGTLVNALTEHNDKSFATDLMRSFKGIEPSVSNDDFDNLPDITEEPEPESDESPFGVMSLREVMTREIKVEYLIEDLMTKGQPMVIGGPAKALKTSITIDLVLSLAAGGTALDKFQVNGRHRVLFLSAESGLGTLQEKFRAAIASKGVGDYALDNIFLGDRVPRLDSLEDKVTNQGGKRKVSEADGLKLKKFLLSNEIDVVIIDPLYLALPSEESANLQAQGELLNQFVNLMLEAEVTPVLLHHTRKTEKTGKPLSLNSLSGAGIAEFTRQWVLLSRRSDYDGTGRHDLHFVWGGSAGHSGYQMLDVDEGSRVVRTEDGEVDLTGDNTLAQYTASVTESDGVNRDWRKWSLIWRDPAAEKKQKISEIDAMF